MPLTMGAPAPMFTARTHARADYAFGSLGGRFILLAFLPEPGPERDAAETALRVSRSLFGDTWVAFGVVRDQADFDAIKPPGGGRWYFHDAEGEIAKAYALRGDNGSTAPQWVLIDPTMRIIRSRPIAEAAETFDEIRAFDDVEAHAGVPMHAPVLIVPRVFEPDFCRRLIDVYAEQGGYASGVMRDIGGKTVGVLDDFKKRRDANVHDEALKREIQTRIAARLLPQIKAAFMFTPTRMERYLVARYDAQDGGYFKPHRDNTTLATTHRQFACSINLNADFEGGDLRFPEYGAKTYRPPMGGAVIFSCSLLHEATRVTAGTRYAFLPFLYNEAGAKLRRENVAHLDPAHIEAMAEQAGRKAATG